MSRDLPNCPEAEAVQRRSATLIGQTKVGPALGHAPGGPEVGCAGAGEADAALPQRWDLG